MLSPLTICQVIVVLAVTQGFCFGPNNFTDILLNYEKFKKKRKICYNNLKGIMATFGNIAQLASVSIATLYPCVLNHAISGIICAEETRHRI